MIDIEWEEYNYNLRNGHVRLIREIVKDDYEKTED
jgi:hypothetical protein